MHKAVACATSRVHPGFYTGSSLLGNILPPNSVDIQAVQLAIVVHVFPDKDNCKQTQCCLYMRSLCLCITCNLTVIKVGSNWLLSRLLNSNCIALPSMSSK